MYIKNLKISNFPKLGQTISVNNLQPLSVFIGRNDVGKSVILDALTFLSTCILHGLSENTYQNTYLFPTFELDVSISDEISNLRYFLSIEEKQNCPVIGIERLIYITGDNRLDVFNYRNGKSLQTRLPSLVSNRELALRALGSLADHNLATMLCEFITNFELLPYTKDPYNIHSSLAMINLPEIGIYPSSFPELISRFRQSTRTTQFILVTYSPELVNCLKPNELFIINRNNNRIYSTRADKIVSAHDHLGHLWLDGAFGI